MSTEKDSPDHDDQLAIEAAAEDARRLELAIEKSDLQWLMSNKQGRRIMWRLLAGAGVYRSSFVSPNAMQVSYLEGRRVIGLEWLGEVMEHCPEQFFAMTTEQQANAKRTGSSSTSGSSGSSTGSGNTKSR